MFSVSFKTEFTLTAVTVHNFCLLIDFYLFIYVFFFFQIYFFSVRSRMHFSFEKKNVNETKGNKKQLNKFPLEKLSSDNI